MGNVTMNAALTKAVVSCVGGNLALDFCNTAGEHLAHKPDEKLLKWELFIRWTVQVGLIEPEAYAELVRHPAPMGKIVQLREAIYRVGLAIARRGNVSERDLLAIREDANAPSPAVVAGQHGLHWRFDSQRVSAQLRAVLANEALSLFCSPRSLRIGICEGGSCGWLFLDESRGKRRRWCDMQDCGNREKARRYYQQKRKK